MKVGFQFRHLDESSTYVTREDWPKVEELIDQLILKNRAEYKMVNSVKRLNGLRDFLRGSDSIESHHIHIRCEYLGCRDNAEVNYDW